MIDDDDDVGVPEFVHDPLYPPRQGHHGECVFTERWKVLMAKRGDAYTDNGQSNYMLCMVLRWCDHEITQRAASVAATFVRWLGTNCGASFIDDAAKLHAKCSGVERGYIMAWALENQRKSWMNSGFRAIEHILAPDECRENGQLVRRPVLSVDDYEVCEAIAEWLAEADAVEFVEQCKAEIAQRNLAERVAAAVERKDYHQVKFLLKDFGAAP